MIKIRINLLPGEIKDKQKVEKFMVMAILGIALVVGLLGGLYAYNAWKIKTAEDKVALLQSEAEKINRSIQSLRVYEQKLKDVQIKKQILQQAISGQVVWSKILEELMVVTPDDVSLTSLSGNSDGITFNGQVPDLGGNPDTGHKPVADWLVHLAQINPTPEVWLISSEKQKNTVNFISTLKFKNSSVPPAPPRPSGK